MFDAHVTDSPPLPPQYDAVLAAGAILGYGGLGALLVVQGAAGLHLSWNGTFGIIVWCLAVSGPSAICWMARPQITHMAYAMRLGLALEALPNAPHITPPRAAFAAKHWVWGSCGNVAGCCWTLAAGLDLGDATGLLTMHSHALNASTLVLCQVGAVCVAVRIMGPSLAAVDEIYRAARGDLQAPTGAEVIDLRVHKGGKDRGLRGEAR